MNVVLESAQRDGEAGTPLAGVVVAVVVLVVGVLLVLFVARGLELERDADRHAVLDPLDVPARTEVGTGGIDVVGEDEGVLREVVHVDDGHHPDVRGLPGLGAVDGHEQDVAAVLVADDDGVVAGLAAAALEDAPGQQLVGRQGLELLQQLLLDLDVLRYFELHVGPGLGVRHLAEDRDRGDGRQDKADAQEPEDATQTDLGGHGGSSSFTDGPTHIAKADLPNDMRNKKRPLPRVVLLLHLRSRFQITIFERKSEKILNYKAASCQELCWG